MVQIGPAVVSPDIFEKKFVCSLPECKGMCCVYGESGAPLNDDEVTILQEIYPKVKPYMTPAGIAVVEQQGVYDTDWDNDRVTPLIGDSEDCAYACAEKGVVGCAIEKAFMNGEISFRKPVSCHLYPIRITKYADFDAVNYHQWNVCRSALKIGEKTGTPLYVFLKDAFIRKYGAEWYEQLCLAAEYLEKNKK
ncbi:MAG: DUF3109 family protein [Bacteroidales bacterium]|jgi:hypothetical protein|nr:DUF3109 family protein [Bacteroidales bacterium]